jgi:hypothetical protein
MSQTLNYVPTFDGSNYGYWKSRMCFFLKSNDVWQIVEFGWTKLKATTVESIPHKNARLANDSMLYIKRLYRLNS